MVPAMDSARRVIDAHRVVSQFAATTVQAEHFDQGGIGVGYSGNWAGNTLSDFRAEEQVAVAQLNATAPPNYAVRGPADRWVGYTVDVATPGRYKVTFRASTGSFQDSLIALLTADGELIGGEMEVPGMGDFTAFSEVSVTADFETTGRKTLRLRFTSGETQVAWVKLVPANLSLIGPQMPTPAAPTSQAAQGVTHVGTAFAVNAEGTINKLRYFVNNTELAAAQQPGHSISLRLWRVTSATLNPSDGQITYVADPNPLCDPVTLELSGTQAAWFSATIPAVPVSPGLYMVSANVNASYSLSTIPAGATPGALTLVAGSITRSPTSVFPAQVNSELGFPTSYFWMDVSFNPAY